LTNNYWILYNENVIIYSLNKTSELNFPAVGKPEEPVYGVNPIRD